MRLDFRETPLFCLIPEDVLFRRARDDANGLVCGSEVGFSFESVLLATSVY